MNFKYVFIVILIIIFSLSAVAAGENVTDESGLVSGGQICVSENHNEKLCENQDLSNNPSSSGNDTDLAVWIDVENVQKGKLYNQPGYEVPWNVSVWVNSGIARNVTVDVTLGNTLECISHEVAVGTFNPSTGVWNVGDLTDSDGKVTLSILTKLKDGSKFKLIAEATTDSRDIDITNNWDSLFIKSGVSKFDSNMSQTSSDIAQPKHEFHTSGNNGWVIIDEEEEENPPNPDEPSLSPDDPSQSPDGPSDNPGEKGKGGSGEDDSNPNQNPDSGTGEGSGSASKSLLKSNAKMLARSTEPISSAISNALGGVFNPVSSIIGSDVKGNLSAETIKAISAQDYTKIPIIIFCVFLVLLAVIAAYGKFKH